MKRITLLVSVIAAGLLLNVGCGGGSTSEEIVDDTVSSYHGTQNPGDYWTFSITGNELTATNVTLGETSSGTMQALTGEAEGFTEITGESDEKSYAMMIPGVGFYAAQAPFVERDHGMTDSPNLQYVSTKPIISAISKDMTCDDIQTKMPFTYVGTLTPDATWRSDDPDTWAAFSGTIVSTGNDNYSMSGYHYYLNGTIKEAYTVTGTCSNGVIEVDTGDGDITRVAFNNSGMFFVDDPSRGSMVGFQSDTDISANALYGMSFLGMRYHPDYCTNDAGDCLPETQPLKGTIAEDGSSVNATLFTNIAEGEISASFNMPIQLEEQMVPGMIKGTVTDEDGEHDAIWIVRQVEGKYQLILISDNWPSMGGHNIFMIEK